MSEIQIIFVDHDGFDHNFIDNSEALEEEQVFGEDRVRLPCWAHVFLSQWGPGSHAAGWYAGAHPFSLTNNQVCCQFFSNVIQVCLFYGTCSGIGGNTQGSQEEPHISNRAAIGPAHTDAGAAGNLIS